MSVRYIFMMILLIEQSCGHRGQRNSYFKRKFRLKNVFHLTNFKVFNTNKKVKSSKVFITIEKLKNVIIDTRKIK